MNSTGSGPTGDRTGSPSARRSGQASWRDPRLALGVVLVAASVVLGATLLGGADDTVRVWAAARDLNTGEPVSRDDLVAQSVRFASAADADRYLSAAAPVADLVVQRGVGSGELLPRGALADDRPVPVVEVPVSAPAQAIPATVRVGSVVDVWVTPADQAVDAAEVTEPAVLAFDDVRVVAAPQSTGALGPGTTRQIIIGVEKGTSEQLGLALARLASGTTVVTKQG